MEVLRPLASLVLPGKCFDSILLDWNFGDAACLKLALSKCLGYGMILGGSLVKLPQILKILNAKSATGLSVAAVISDLAGVTATTAYSFAQKFPFSAYGEGAFLMLETALILLLALHYQGRTLMAAVFALIYFTACFISFSDTLPMGILWWGQVLAAPTVISGKLWQARENFYAGHTGQLSMITMSLLLLGCLARIFTSITETNDQIMILSYGFAALANALLVIQILIYWEATDKITKTTSSKKKE
ncbi:mannose-P-dolichol utilization defect 1 protein [Galendromus occidentalis]|uniref:Solute carrier family 66 member 3 n=1 Tax=Galendromus occidentalis TaxID=34638 RepID=A0AAJ6VXH8_9ACAR|nr:mannose-P-dolichol utilization defect 1 protein [Galendromus occidentalis]